MRILLTVLLCAMSSEMTIVWSDRQPMPRAEAGGASGFLGGELVIAGGTAWEGDVKHWLSDVQIYRPASNQWRRGPVLPVPLAYGAFISSPEELEIFGGSDGKTIHRDAWKLDRRKTKWERSGSVPADLLLARAARVDDSVFLFGGCSDVADLTRCSDAVWRREGKSEWRRISALPGGPVAMPAVAVAGSDIYLFGGCSMPVAGNLVNHAHAYRYHPPTNRWTTLRNLPTGNRALSAVAVHGNSIYLLGGYTDAGFTSEVLLYNIGKDSYTRSTPIPVPLAGIDFVLSGDTLYGAGGEDRMRSRSAPLFQGRLAGRGQ